MYSFILHLYIPTPTSLCVTLTFSPHYSAAGLTLTKHVSHFFRWSIDAFWLVLRDHYMYVTVSLHRRTLKTCLYSYLFLKYSMSLTWMCFLTNATFRPVLQGIQEYRFCSMSSFSVNAGSIEVFPSCDKVKSWGVEFECTTETASLAKSLAIKSQYFDKSIEEYSHY